MKFRVNGFVNKTLKIPYQKTMRIRNHFDLKDVEVYRGRYGREVREKIYLRILRRYAGFIAREVSAVRVSGYDFEDLMQESYIVVHEVLEHVYRAELKTPFWPFLRLCIKRNLFSLIKASKNQKNFSLNNSADFELLAEFRTPWISSHENRIIDKMAAKAIVDQLKLGLSELEYKSFFEKNVNLLTYKEISSKYGFDTKQIDNAMVRVTKKIKRIVSRLDKNQSIAS